MQLENECKTPGVIKETIPLAGLNINLFKSADEDLTKDIVVLFFLHGRFGSADKVQWVPERLVKETTGKGNRELFVITLDQRNHGARLIDPRANKGWSSNPAEHNPRHALDQYAIFDGTAHDVFHLMNYLPAFLFPNDERKITEYGYSGISLGGHSTWLAVANDPRLTIGIPIIGCPDYMGLMSARARGNGVPVEPPYFPDAFVKSVASRCPMSKGYDKKGDSNPFYGKKIFVASGAADPLVPWDRSKDFVEKLEVGDHGRKEVFVQEKTGHTCTHEMVTKIVAFLIELL
ncbi:Alpha/Beta hydrolase protein [Schizophyllum commune]